MRLQEWYIALASEMRRFLGLQLSDQSTSHKIQWLLTWYQAPVPGKIVEPQESLPCTSRMRSSTSPTRRNLLQVDWPPNPEQSAEHHPTQHNMDSRALRDHARQELRRTPDSGIHWKFVRVPIRDCNPLNYLRVQVKVLALSFVGLRPGRPGICELGVGALGWRVF